jgi:integrase/recombinase XerD
LKAGRNKIIRRKSPSSSSPSSLSLVTATEDLIFNRNLAQATEGLNDYVRKHLCEKISRENASVIVDYILAMHSEIRLSDNYRLNTIVTLKSLAEFVNKPFKDMERQDIINFLNTFRKSEEKDPMHKWVGTYNQIFARIARFFKWYHNRDIPPSKRPEPQVIQNIGRQKRLEEQTYNDNDVWTLGDDILFLKYCPSKRDRCFHMMSRDTGTRTHELFKLKIKDIDLTTNGTEWYGEIPVNGKTGPRTVPMFHSVPYFKAWIEDHPVKGNPDAPLFCAMQNKRNFGRRLSKGAMYTIYVTTYQKQYFSKLAAPVAEGGDPTVPEEDKKKLRVLLKKPWNPYLVHRHSTLTERGEEGGLGDSPQFDQYAGWKMGSPMRRKYVHLKSKSSSRALLKQWGIKLETEEGAQQQADKNRNLLKPLSCPSCNEVNEAVAKSCIKCGMILSFDHYKATTKEVEETRKKITQLETQQEERLKEMQEQIAGLMERNIVAFNWLKEEMEIRKKEEAERREVGDIDGIRFPECFKLVPRKDKEKKYDYNKSNY